MSQCRYEVRISKHSSVGARRQCPAEATGCSRGLIHWLQVRKKAVMALHRFEQLDPLHEGPLSAAEIDVHLRRMLCDKVGARGMQHAAAMLAVT